MPIFQFLTSFISPSLSPSKLVKSLHYELQVLAKPSNTNGENPSKNLANISQYLGKVNKILVSEFKHDYDRFGFALYELSTKIFATGVLVLMVENMEKLEFEAKKLVGYIFINLLNEKSILCPKMVRYLKLNKDILYIFLDRCQFVGKCITFGQIVLECAKFEPLLTLILDSQYFWKFFVLAESPSFEVASIATRIIRTLLVSKKHKMFCAEFLSNNYDDIFEGVFPELFASDNYVAQTESLRILSDIFLQDQNRQVFEKFVASAANLKRIIILLGAPSKRLCIAAFNVFKLFFCLPEKHHATVTLHKILFKNKNKLLKTLTDIRMMCLENTTLQKEFVFIIPIIQEMNQPDNPTSGTLTSVEDQQRNLD